MGWPRLIFLSVSAALCCAATASASPTIPPPPDHPAPPRTPRLTPPANVPQLSVARPYTLFTDGRQPATLNLDAPTAPADAGDWYRYWSVDAAGLSAERLTAKRREWGIRGAIIIRGSIDDLVRLGGAADYPAVRITPGLSRDAARSLYAVGFQVRLAADLCRRIPLPTLDMSGLKAADAAWAGAWVDECVRNGVAGLSVVPPRDAVAAETLRAALAPLNGPNVYLPPDSEVALLLSNWSSRRADASRVYAGLRASGVWPVIVSTDPLRTRSASLARYRVIIVPWAGTLDGPSRAAVEDAARRGATVVCTGLRPGAGERVLAARYDGAPAITERRTGDGRVLTATVSPFGTDGAWSGFWQGIVRDAGVPARPWVEAVTAGNVGTITGRYTRPGPAK